MERFSNNESNRNNESNMRKIKSRKAKGKKSVTFRNNLKTSHNVPMNIRLIRIRFVLMKCLLLGCLLQKK